MSSHGRPMMEEQIAFWNWHWSHWKERRVINDHKQRRHAAVLEYIRALPLGKMQILDVGCGVGAYTEKLTQFGPVTGIDLSESAIQMARQRCPSAAFLVGSVCHTSLPAKHYDLVVSQEVIDHVDNQVTFVSRVSTVLKDGGYCVLSCANKFLMDRLGDGEFPRQPPGHISDNLDRRALSRLLSPAFTLLMGGITWVPLFCGLIAYRRSVI